MATFDKSRQAIVKLLGITLAIVVLANVFLSYQDLAVDISQSWLCK